MTTTHTVIVTFKPKTDYLEAFQKVMQTVKAELPTVAGCNEVTVFHHTEDPAIFTLVERWENAKMHTTHINGLIASGDWAAIEAMLSEGPNSMVLTEL